MVFGRAEEYSCFVHRAVAFPLLDADSRNRFACGTSKVNPDKRTLDDLRIDRSSSPPSKSRSVWIVVILLLLGLAGAGAWWFNRTKPLVVRTVLVQQPSSGGSDKTLLNASGFVTPRREATVSSKFTGKVVEVLVEEGMKVEAGQILARIDPINVEKNLQLSEAQAESISKALEETRASLEQADREWRRVTKLAAEKIAAQSELDRTESEVKTLKARLAKQQADVKVAEREVAIWKQQLDDTIIRAPFAGIVTSKNAQPGEMISPMSAGGFTRTGICTLVDMTSLEIEVEVSESYINRVGAGQPVEATLDSYPEWKIPAKVIAIIPTADRRNATVKVRLGFEKLDPRILPQMAVKVAFQRSGDAAQLPRQNLMMPQAAVRQHDGKDVVWVVRNGRVERRAVSVGSMRGNEVTIAAGLTGGERVVVEGSEKLADGVGVSEAKP